MADPHSFPDGLGSADPDAEPTQVLDVRPLQRAAAPPPAPPPPTSWSAPDVARVDHRGSLAWDLEVARANNRPATDVGLLLVRVASLLLVLRGLHKLRDFPAFVEPLRANAVAGGAPELIGALVVAGEIALPLLIAVGLATRVAGLLQATVMIVVFVSWTLVGSPLFDPRTGGLTGEPELLFAALALPLVFTGPGRLSIDRAITASGRERRLEKRVARRRGE